tara:strand:+ start:293 stop:520 length:228 start_codon:yes stop_codon:yes gene_type:complete
MTEKEIEQLADNIVDRIFKKMENDFETMNKEFIEEAVPDEVRIAELEVLLNHYEMSEDYILAANVFAIIKQLKSR